MTALALGMKPYGARKPTSLTATNKEEKMKLLKVLTAVALLATSSTAALASKNPPLNADVWKVSQGDKLYEAYRKYGYVKYCNETRQGYLAVWVNDVQLDRARARIPRPSRMRPLSY